MTWLVTARLVNEVFSDPCVLIDFRFGRRAILFDLGEIGALSAREILRVSHVFVSHTHMDHFAGFDRLLRFSLRRTAPLHLLGPEGFIDRVAHKLAAYTWNLLTPGATEFVIVASEFDGFRVIGACEFRGQRGFERNSRTTAGASTGVVLDEEEFRIECAMLDHGIPCLAFAFREKLRVNVVRAGLEQMGLPLGPWLKDAKRAVRLHCPDATPIGVGPGKSVALGLLKRHALRAARGQKIAYVVDAAYHESNIDRIVALARDADQLFIETAFLDADAAIAGERRHLTAIQAGALARRAGVSRLLPFHFSPRYRGREHLLRAEAEQAFRSG